MSKTYSYGKFDRFAWAVVAAGAGIILLIIGLGFTVIVPQQRPAVAVSWLEVLTGSATGQPTFFTPLSQLILVIFGIFALINAVLIYRAGSATIKIDDDAISYNRGQKIVRVPWPEVVNVKKHVTVGVRAGATEVVSIITETDPNKIIFNSKIKGYDTLLQAIQTHTKVKF
ncbi:MAG: hypothetical protein ACFFCD_11895 [Promethearchaeota archaeon]